jgi:transaldolase
MNKLDSLKVKIFADGADLEDIRGLYSNPIIKGFTTNPTLMRKAGIEDYEVFGRNLLSSIPDRPVSLEVFADDCEEMIVQAKKIASWGQNVNIKIPICNTKGESTETVIEQLSDSGVVVNVTAIMTIKQVAMVSKCLNPNVPAIISVFAGRVADTGVDPIPHMVACAEVLSGLPKAELLWASPREVLNIFQADKSGCQIITVASDLLRKLDLIGKDLDDYSLETVKMFRKDAVAAGYKIL